MDHRNPDSVNRLGEEGGSDASTSKIVEECSNDKLLDLMEQWEEFYRRGEEPPPEWPAADPALREALRLRIEDQKRLYVLMGFARTPRDEVKKADDRLPSYPDHEIIMETGRGGMGVVYKARDLKLSRIVAIKTIAEGRHATQEQRERFQAEAHAIARLHHPNIIAIHAIGEHENRPYLSLEFAEGGSLVQRLAEKPMAPREAATLVETLARAVHAAHQAGVVHRDLKPSNVLLTADGVPKVSDFGLAKLLDSDSGSTATGQPIGTPSYMAPEQAEGLSKQVAPSADTYALGAILYQALTGRPPFLGESAMETLKLVTSTEAVHPRRLRPDVPRDLETICLKCLEKPPGKRYATALDLAEDLRRFQQGEPILARRIGVLQRSCKWTKRHPWQTISAATVLIAASVFIGFVYWHNVQLRAEVNRTEARAAESRRNYQQARSTIQAMLARFNDRRFAGTPRMKELGRDQMEDALTFYNNILRQADANDPAIRVDTARAFGLLSTVQYELGRNDQAEQQVRQALDLLENLRSEHPDNSEYLSLQVECFVRLGVYLDVLGRFGEAVAANQESVRLVEMLAEAAPDNLTHQESVAMCHDAYATRLRRLNRFSDARDHYRKAIEVRQALDPSKLPGLVQRHVETLVNDGVTLWDMQQIQEAEARFRQAEKLELAIPTEQRNNISFGKLYLNWSGMLYQSKHFEKAIERATVGLNLVEPYLRVEPNDAVARDECLKLHGNRGLALSNLGKNRESVDEWTRVIELSTEPVPPRYRMNLAIELAQAGELPRALSQAQLVKSALDSGGVERYNLGCLYSLCAVAMRKDPSVPPDQRARLFESHIADAIRWLNAAADAGFFRDLANRDHAKKDSDLEILRDRPEFRHLIESNVAKP